MYVALLFSLLISVPTQSADQAWEAWKDGDVFRAQELAIGMEEGPEKHHILFLVDYVTGKYERAISHYVAMGPLYPRKEELRELVCDTYLHLRKEGEAHGYATVYEMGHKWLARTSRRAENPLRATLESVTTVPFADVWSAGLWVSFDVEVEGQKTNAILDTGGGFLAMSLEYAKKLGIELVDVGKGYFGTELVSAKFGIVNRFKIGDAVLENVPVVVASPMDSFGDNIMFGSGVLENFLTTIDHKNKKMTLSSRGHAEQRRVHLAMLPKDGVEVPFFLYGENRMFVRGGFGNGKALNFQVDTGLLWFELYEGSVAEASLTAPSEMFREWGVDNESSKRPFFKSSLPLFVGSLKQADLFHIVIPDLILKDFHGVRIDGLIGHAFFKKYTWTIDFDRHVYILHEKALQILVGWSSGVSRYRMRAWR